MYSIPYDSILLNKKGATLKTPNYLKNYDELFQKDPHAANLAWFADAKWGLFLHYGLYSQLKRGEWVLYREDIPLGKYEQLYNSFDPKNFDADFITDLACEAEMKYVNLTACHHEGFCLWNSNKESFNSYAASKRDLVQELAEQCDKKGLGFFSYHTHILNWRHPYAWPREILPVGRPNYQDEPRYLFQTEQDIDKYWEWAHETMRELLAMDAPLAGIWLDIIVAHYEHPHLVKIEDTYNMISELRPDVLLSFKQGATGTEDFASPEFSFHSMAHRYRDKGNEAAAKLAEHAWTNNQPKHNEICMTLQRQAWGYMEDTEHYTPDEVWVRLAYALKKNCNMLANTGPLPDGSIHSDDVACLKEMGRRIRENGWPKPEEAIEPDSWNAPKKNHAAAE